MSDCYLHIIPVDPFYRPAPETIPKIVSAVSSCFSTSIEISVTDEEQVIFFDAGEIPNRINCPSCHSKLEPAWWIEQMNQDYKEDIYQMQPIVMPCCGKEFTLNELKYDRSQGFACFAVSVMNPAYVDLAEKDIQKVEEVLACKLKVVVQQL